MRLLLQLLLVPQLLVPLLMAGRYGCVGGRGRGREGAEAYDRARREDGWALWSVTLHIATLSISRALSS